MSSPDVACWPKCTEPDCDHVRSWSSPEYALIAQDVAGWLLDHWTDHATGLAACMCHPEQTVHTRARFPCDPWRRNRAS